jgi:molybdopterin molybdotransferase
MSSASRHVHDHDSGEGLRSVDEAREHVLSQINPLTPIELPLTDAFGCVAAVDVTSPVTLPAFASSAMDGFAVRASDVAEASSDRPAELKIVGRASIGHRPDATVGSGEAVAIATGAPIPGGADAIVPIENAEVIDAELVRVFEAVREGRHVRPRGEDVAEGELLVPQGKRLGAPELGLLANAGVPHPMVHPRPRVVVLSTGDELIPPTTEPDFGQVHDSNAYTLFGALREVGAIPIMAGIVRDDVEQLRDTVFSYDLQADAFISSGGVSVGERDVVKAAFFQRGDVAFYRVAMQPGMPQGFGFVEGKPFFGLPGNPVSVFVSFEVFVRPAVLKMMGRAQLDRPEITATLTADLEGPVGKMQYARVEVARGADGWTATPTGGRGSNLISTIARANGLAMVPPGSSLARAGSEVRVMLFRSSED